MLKKLFYALFFILFVCSVFGVSKLDTDNVVKTRSLSDSSSLLEVAFLLAVFLPLLGLFVYLLPKVLNDIPGGKNEDRK